MINENVQNFLRILPSDVKLVAAVKTRTTQEVNEAIKSGIRIIGHNYIQEAETMFNDVLPVRWHFIGHLQQNKVKKAVAMFDMIETVDSYDLATEISKRCAEIDKTIDILVEVNSGCEDSKSGVRPDEVINIIKEIAVLPNIKIKGLMTMGPAYLNGEELRPYFSATRALFRQIEVLSIDNVQMETLSMGMSDSYMQAIEEGATSVRIGSAIFGQRLPKN